MFVGASFLVLSAVATLLCGYLYRLSSGRCTSRRTMTGKTVIITGSSSGIGKEAALDLAQRGARVILACRNLDKAERVAEEIRKATGSSQVVVRILDTASMASVRKFAREILATETSLDVLINNAGTYVTSGLTSEGLQLTMATNHFGHFLLTNLLLDLLKKSSPSRIINVSSNLHSAATSLDPDTLNYEDGASTKNVSYNRSKLCNVLFSLELSQKLKGTGVTSNSLHPGFVKTGIFYDKGISLLGNLLGFFAHFFAKDSKLGAQTIIYLAVAAEVEAVSGRYFKDCQECQSSSLGRQMSLARKVWDASERYVQLEPEERHY